MGFTLHLKYLFIVVTLSLGFGLGKGVVDDFI